MGNKLSLLILLILVAVATNGCGAKTESNNKQPANNDISTGPSSVTTNPVTDSITPTTSENKPEESAFTETTDNNPLTEEPTPEVTTEPVQNTLPLHLNIINESNMFFAKYDINIYIDDTKVGYVQNGSRYTEQVMTSYGSHKIKFTDSTNENTLTESDFDISSEATLKFRLKAHESSIEILESLFIPDSEENKVIVPDFCGYMLPEAKKELKNLGIEDIKTTVNSNEFIVDDNNWIVFSQNVDPGSKMDRYESIILVCGRVKDFVETYMFQKPLTEIIEIGTQYGFTIEFVDDLTGSAINISSNDTDPTEWTIVSHKTLSNSKKIVTYNMAFCGMCKVPSVVGTTVSFAKSTLKQGHFSNISLYSDSDEPIYNEDEWTVIEQSIDAGTECSALETISLKVEKIESEKEAEKLKPVYYSTNDKETAKEGNQGVYAYCSKGGTYKNYYIIDFDEGYVYFFSDGNGDGTCDKVKIVSGDLNDRVIITYHDVDGSKWSYGLRFGWTYQPDNLIVQDQYGEYDYMCTNLKTALEIRDTKTIKEF